MDGGGLTGSLACSGEAVVKERRDVSARAEKVRVLE